MSVLESSIEDSEGRETQNPSEKQILAVLNQFGKGIDHCNFNYGQKCISAYGDADTGIYLSYIDDDGNECNTKDTITPDAVCKIFMDARESQTAWMQNLGVEKSTSSQSSGVRPENGSQSTQGPQSLKDQLLNTVKREVSRSINRSVGNGIRNLFRKR